MAENEKPKRVYVTTPRGVFQWPRLNEPDYGNEKFKKPDGEYSVTLILKASDPAVKKFIAEMTPHYEAALEKGRAEFKKLKAETRKELGGKIKEKLFYTELLDQETEEPTGEIKMRFAMKAGGTYKSGPKEGKKWSRKPKVFDARGTYLPKPPSIWGGTEGRVNFEAEPYFIPGTGTAGLRMKLEAAKVLKLVSEGGAADASRYGFGDEEDGYTHEEDAMSSDESDTSDKADADGGSDEDDGSGDF